MALFLVDYTYDLPEGGAIELTANDSEQAELFAEEYVKDLYDTVKNIVITTVREIK